MKKMIKSKPKGVKSKGKKTPKPQKPSLPDKPLSEYIWYEKYRPTVLSELSLPDTHTKAFTTYIEQQNIPHLLFEGSHGSGKTTCAYILMNSIKCKKRIMNASGADRGIDAMKEDVVNFAKSKTPDGELKIIFLDEADYLTAQAQASLRNTMETYNKQCRFIMSCNYVDRIIPALRSRTTTYTFNSLPKQKALDICLGILKEEGIKYKKEDKKAIKDIITLHDTDMRSIMNNLQMASISGVFEADTLIALGIDLETLWKHILKGEVKSLRTMLVGIKNYTPVYRHLFDVTLKDKKAIPSDCVTEVVYAVAEASARERTVPDREINFVSCALNIMDTLGITPNRQK